jgi:hypothetical protein
MSGSGACPWLPSRFSMHVEVDYPYRGYNFTGVPVYSSERHPVADQYYHQRNSALRFFSSPNKVSLSLRTEAAHKGRSMRNDFFGCVSFPAMQGQVFTVLVTLACILLSAGASPAPPKLAQQFTSDFTLDAPEEVSPTASSPSDSNLPLCLEYPYKWHLCSGLHHRGSWVRLLLTCRPTLIRLTFFVWSTAWISSLPWRE